MVESFPTPELETLRKVITLLVQTNIPYMLTGSMALNFYGHPRATNDFDIVIQVGKQSAQNLYELFRNDFYVSEEAIREALAHDRLFNLIDEKTVFKVDLIVGKDDDFSREQFLRRQPKEVLGLKAYVISPEDLILSKLEWSKESRSEMQERDIRTMMSLLTGKLDFAYMERWATQRGYLERLKSFYA